VTSKLKHLSTVLPMSQAALDVVELVRDGKHDAQQIAAATARDPSLAVEILKLANSSFYNPAGEKIAEMERAVMRIGLRRVGELAMATTALTALTTKVLPWMDVSLAWRRSIAAGLAADVLVGKAGLTIDREGLFLSALMHGLGRVALGTLFPNEYSMMIDACRETNQPLLERETKVFSESHSETMVRLLEMWDFPSEICEPLKHFLIPYSALRRLDESLRNKVALLKLSVLVGDLAVGQWESWGLLDLPGNDVTASLGIDAVSDVIAQIREDLVQVVHFRKPEVFDGLGRAADNRERHARVLSYCSVSPSKIDFLPHIAEGMGVVLQSLDQAEINDGQPMLVNGIGSPVHLLAPYLEDEGGWRHSVIIGENENSRMALHRHSANVVALPCSVAALQTAFQLVSNQNESKSPATRLNAAKRERQSAFHREYDK
jgi:HD-like signal output (HDOD) protein